MADSETYNYANASARNGTTDTIEELKMQRDLLEHELSNSKDQLN